MIVSRVTPAKGAPNCEEIEKNERFQKRLGVSDPKFSGQAWPPPMFDDPEKSSEVGQHVNHEAVNFIQHFSGLASSSSD
jgi:hypothetical protein